MKILVRVTGEMMLKSGPVCRRFQRQLLKNLKEALKKRRNRPPHRGRMVADLGRDRRPKSFGNFTESFWHPCFFFNGTRMRS